MSTRHVLSVTGDVALQLLRLTAASADVFPPLKSVASGVLHVAEIVEKFRSNKQEWQEFLQYVQNATASVIDSLARTDPSQTDLNDKLTKLQSIMEDIVASIKAKQDRSTYKRFIEFMKDPDLITSMRKELDNAVGLFTASDELRSIISTEINVKQTLDTVVANTKLLSGIAQDTADTAANTKAIVLKADSISHKASKIVLNANLEKLRYIQGASGDPYRVCLPDTRINVMDEIFKWAENSDAPSGAKIYLLTAVAGAGKSTIAHTVACHFADKGQLVSSFFFDRDSEGRNTPIALFTTIAADLAQVSDELSARITAAIENEKGLPLAPLARQFQELVLKPCQESSISGRRIIVIDALDEGCNTNLLKILCDEIPHLPGAISIFLTSRMQSQLGSLSRKPHVPQVELDIDSSANLLDIAKFISHRLQEVASARNLGDGWPGQQLRTQFEQRAAGLFIWVAIFCNFLLSRSNPTRELERLLSDPGLASNSAEAQIDKLYARILASCDWEDEDFVAGYDRIMGTAIVTKAPLTISAQNDLFNEEPATLDFVLDTLSPLLTGMSKDHHHNQPVRVLHQSLRDFLVVRAVSSQEHIQFHVDEQKHSQDLALACLCLLNRELHDNMVGVGYLAKDESELPGVPTIGEGEITEALRYACRFWIDHLLDVKPVPSAELVQSLETFLQTKAVAWIELMSSMGNLRGLSEVREWVQISLAATQIERLQESKEIQAEGFWSISLRLVYDDRREEALTANQEAVELRRQLAKDRPAAFTPVLANSLNNLSNRLSDLGHREEALTAIQEAVELRRQLAKDRPAAFTPNLATALYNLSRRLSDSGRREDALSAMQESTALYRHLAHDRPTVFARHLTDCLDSLFRSYEASGRHDEAQAANSVNPECPKSQS